MKWETDYRKEDTTEITSIWYPKAQEERRWNPTNIITEMLQLIPHEDEMLHLPSKQHKIKICLSE